MSFGLVADGQRTHYTPEMGSVPSLQPRSRAGLNALLLLLAQCGRLLYLGRMPDRQLVRQVPDDAFYYLEAARNFARLGRWTFDSTEPASGFHLLWGYVLALFYKVFPHASLHAMFVAGSLLQVLCLVVAAWLVTKTAERIAGRHTWAGVLLVFLSAAALLPGTWLMETSFVVLAAALAAYSLLRRDAPVPLTAACAIGLLVSFSRSDSGLMVFWLWVVQVYLWRRGVTSRGMVVSATALLAGAVMGVGLVALHTHWVSGEWAQASAQQKLFWSNMAGHSAKPAVRIALSFFNPVTNLYIPYVKDTLPSGMPLAVSVLIKLLAVGLAGTGLALRIREERRAELVPFLAALALAIGSYCFFYRYDSASVQEWYVGNFEVPAAVLSGVCLSAYLARFRLVTLTVAGAMCLCGIALSLNASFPWQEAMWRAGVYLREHPAVRPVGSWNAGIIGFFADNGVTNMDGLMNDAVLPYAKRGDLERYLAKRGTGYILESPDMWTRRMALRGGYADGALQRCVAGAEDLFPDDPDNFYAGGHIQLYRMDLGCLEGSPLSSKVR